MSIATEITRIQNLRNTLRTKLVSMLGLSSSADLEDCVTAVNNLKDNGAISQTLHYVSASDEFYASHTIPAGHHNGAGTVKANIQNKSITPKTVQQLVVPDDGKMLGKVTVNAIPSDYQDVSAVTATAGDVLANKVFVTANGTVTAGTMANNGGMVGTLNGMTGTTITIPAGYHNGLGKVVLTNDVETALAAI